MSRKEFLALSCPIPSESHPRLCPLRPMVTGMAGPMVPLPMVPLPPIQHSLLDSSGPSGWVSSLTSPSACLCLMTTDPVTSLALVILQSSGILFFGQ